MAASIPLPASIGKYRITGVLGQGAMGMVYKDFDPHINRMVAIKTIHKNLLGDGDAVDSIAARFRNEAQAVGRIAHPGVVAIYELGQDEHTAFIVMEFVDGRSLDHVLRDSPLLPKVQLLSIMDQLLDALGAAHSHGVWHRDIKPANLMLTATGLLKLTDFGIARIEDAGLTQVAAVIGSPGYMAPEQYRGRGVDHRVDLFAAGVLLYRLLVGRLPFTGTAEQQMYQIINETPPPPSQLAPHRTVAYDALVLRALAKDASQRFASAAEFREALSAAAIAATIAATSEDFATTLMVPRQQSVETLAAAPPSRPTQPTQPTSTSGTPGPTGWDAPALSRIERALASQIGPLAKLMVRDASRNCADLPSLARAVAEHIADPAERQKFLRDATGSSSPVAQASQSSSSLGRSTVSTQVPTPSSTRSIGSATQTTGSTQPPSEAYLARALQVLTRHLGPIAKIVLKRAAQQAPSEAAFVQAVIAACPELDEAQLRRELK